MWVGGQVLLLCVDLTLLVSQQVIIRKEFLNGDDVVSLNRPRILAPEGPNVFFKFRIFAYLNGVVGQISR